MSNSGLYVTFYFIFYSFISWLLKWLRLNSTDIKDLDLCLLRETVNEEQKESIMTGQ